MILNTETQSLSLFSVSLCLCVDINYLCSSAYMIQNTSSTMQLKILLRNVTKPPVWRRVLIPSDLARQKTAVVLGAIRSQKDSGEADDPKYSDLGESDADVRHYRSLMHSGEEMWDRE